MNKTQKEKALRAFIAEQKEPKNDKPCSCMTCKWAMLHRYGTNPILAACEKRPQQGNIKFPYEIMVASFLWICPHYAKSEDKKWVELRVLKSA